MASLGRTPRGHHQDPLGLAFPSVPAPKPSSSGFGPFLVATHNPLALSSSVQPKAFLLKAFVASSYKLEGPVGRGEGAAREGAFPCFCHSPFHPGPQHHHLQSADPAVRLPLWQPLPVPDALQASAAQLLEQLEPGQALHYTGERWGRGGGVLWLPLPIDSQAP